MLTIPGFGPYVSSIVLARIGDLHRFIGRRQVIRLCGLDLNANRSGKRSDAAVPVISKRGNSELRNALYQAAKMLVIAWTMMKTDADFDPSLIQV